MENHPFSFFTNFFHLFSFIQTFFILSLFYKLFFFFSGYDEYEDEYAHIITENSPKGLVEQVVEEFQPVQLPELLVITGRACTRILSGYQKTKKEEETILANLREEGLLAKPGGKGQGGISFEIVDIASAGEDLSVGVAPPQGVIPDRKLRYFHSISRKKPFMINS